MNEMDMTLQDFLLKQRRRVCICKNQLEKQHDYKLFLPFNFIQKTAPDMTYYLGLYLLYAVQQLFEETSMLAFCYQNITTFLN